MRTENIQRYRLIVFYGFYRMRDKTADFQNMTKQPIFKTGQNSRF